MQKIEEAIEHYYAAPHRQYPAEGDTRKYAAIGSIIEDKLRKTINGEWVQWEACMAELQAMPTLKDIFQFNGHQWPSLGLMSVLDNRLSGNVSIEECFILELSLLCPIFTMHQSIRVRLFDEEQRFVMGGHYFVCTKPSSLLWINCFAQIKKTVKKFFPTYSFMAAHKMLQMKQYPYYPYGNLSDAHLRPDGNITAYDLLFCESYWNQDYSLV
jgi:hypothetical protein